MGRMRKDAADAITGSGAPVRILSIETSVVSLPFDIGGPPPLFAGKPWTNLEILLVRIETEDGFTGWGEAFGHVSIPATRAALDSVVAPLCIGRDSGDINALTRDLARAVHLLGRNGPFVYALSGIDIALWDIAGKRAGLPLHRLLGGGPVDSLTGYASLLWFGDPARVAENVRAARERGYGLVKLHETTLEAVRAAKDAAEGAEIMLDTNCPWTVAQAVGMARKLKHDGLHWLEEPVWPPEDHAGLARVRREGIRIAAGENAAGLHDFKHMFDAGALDIAQPSVTKIGGVSEMRRIVSLAEAYGVDVVPHCPYFGPGFLASLHVIAAMPAKPPVEVLWKDMEANPFDPWVRAENGRVRVPQGPGLGCDPDPHTLERYRLGAPTVTREAGRPVS
jgi:L-alanine-DL-glutamate epimerase-like enolase superfamily enzyme